MFKRIFNQLIVGYHRPNINAAIADIVRSTDERFDGIGIRPDDPEQINLLHPGFISAVSPLLSRSMVINVVALDKLGMQHRVEVESADRTTLSWDTPITWPRSRAEKYSN